MTSRVRRLFGRHEMVLLGVTVLLSIVIGALNPAFYSLQNAFAFGGLNVALMFAAA